MSNYNYFTLVIINSSLMLGWDGSLVVNSSRYWTFSDCVWIASSFFKSTDVWHRSRLIKNSREWGKVFPIFLLPGYNAWNEVFSAFPPYRPQRRRGKIRFSEVRPSVRVYAQKRFSLIVAARTKKLLRIFDKSFGAKWKSWSWETRITY